MYLLYTIINTNCLDTKKFLKLQLYRFYCLLYRIYCLFSYTSFVGTFAGEMNGHSDGTNFMPHFITVNAGEVCLHAAS